MIRYVIKRLLMLIPVLFGITFVVFLILSLSPNDPAMIVLGAEDFTLEQLYAQREAMGLNDPLIVRYFTYMWNAVRGDFGTSWFLGFDVAYEFTQRLPFSLRLGIYANLISIILGIPLGIIAGVWHNKGADFAISFFALIMASAPSFWLSMLGQVYLSVGLGIFPVFGADTLWHFMLPAFVLGGILTASNVRITRTWLVDVIRSDYVRTARAKGAREFRVIMKHALRNSLLPVITSIGMGFAMIMGMVAIVEIVFAIPGASAFLISAVRTGDMPVVMGCIVVVALFVGIVNLLVDLLYAVADPRVKYS